MLSSLRRVDPKALLSIALSAALLAGSYLGLYSPSVSRLDRAQSALTQAENDLQRARATVARMSEAGLQDAEAIGRAVGGMERALPDSYDDFMVAQIISRVFNESGMSLRELPQPKASERLDDNVSFISYSMSGSGEIESLYELLRRLPNSFEGPATWNTLDISSQGPGGISSGSSVTFTGQIDLWILSGSRSVAGGAASSNGEAQTFPDTQGDADQSEEEEGEALDDAVGTEGEDDDAAETGEGTEPGPGGA